SWADLSPDYAGAVAFASVYPLVTARALAREFTYEVPDGVGPGAVVEVRFGNARRRGVVTEIGVAPPEGIAAAPVDRVVEELPPALVELALWVAAYYGSTPGRALALVAPHSSAGSARSCSSPRSRSRRKPSAGSRRASATGSRSCTPRSRRRSGATSAQGSPAATRASSSERAPPSSRRCPVSASSVST